MFTLKFKGYTPSGTLMVSCYKYEQEETIHNGVKKVRYWVTEASGCEEIELSYYGTKYHTLYVENLNNITIDKVNGKFFLLNCYKKINMSGLKKGDDFYTIPFSLKASIEDQEFSKDFIDKHISSKDRNYYCNHKELSSAIRYILIKVDKFIKENPDMVYFDSGNGTPFHVFVKDNVLHCDLYCK